MNTLHVRLEIMIIIRNHLATQREEEQLVNKEEEEEGEGGRVEVRGTMIVSMVDHNLQMIQDKRRGEGKDLILIHRLLGTGLVSSVT